MYAFGRLYKLLEKEHRSFPVLERLEKDIFVSLSNLHYVNDFVETIDYKYVLINGIL